MSNPQHDSQNWLVVLTTHGVMEATMIAERLRSLGIPAIVHNEPLGAIYGLTIGPLGEAKVLVPESFFDRATEALDDGSQLLDDDDELPEDE